MIDLHDQRALIDAVIAGAERPIAFLVGSPLSWDKGGGVPGIDDMLSVAKASVRAKLPHRLSDFEKKLSGATGADAYQTAMKWLHGSLTQGGVNEVIRQAVLKARNASSTPHFQGDGDPADWYLPAGARGLAALVASGGERFPGPILTTNFDPLISLSVRNAGARRRLRVIDTDGALPMAVEADPGEVDVIHLHGYWQGANTLHTPAQLTSERPKLTASLRRLLLQRTLVVVAYGGWDDVFTRALVDVLHDAEAQVTVLWCFHEADAVLVETRYARLLTQARAAITSGALHLYGGVDCHSVFSEIAKAQAISTNPMPGYSAACPLPGWQQLTETFRSSLTVLKPAEAIRYFDGGSPSWRHIASSAIPRRKALSSITSAWDNLPDDQCSMQLICAAGGEGKTTLLMQAAIEAARGGSWEVLYRPSQQLGLSPDVVVGLATDKQWLIVIDNADVLIESIYQCLLALHQSNRANVDFLLAARDTDWRNARGDGKPWSQYCKRLPDVVLRGINDDDARTIVHAWKAYGEQGLRGLAKYDTPEAMAVALRQSVETAQSDRREGSFLGGLLDVRFSPTALRSHVRELMDRLEGQVIRGSRHTLRDALIYIAACHGAGIPGTDVNVLADLLGVPRAWVTSLVVGPLGDEAAASISGRHVFTRHRKVAEAILAETESSVGVDLADVWRELISQTVKTSATIPVGRQSHGAVLHVSQRLIETLPVAIDEKRRLEIALAAANAAIASQPERLDHISDLGRTFRAGGEFGNAATTFRDGLAGAKDKVDYLESIRGYWFEWGVCESRRMDSNKDRFADVWLQGLSLSDLLNPARVTLEDVKVACAALGLTFGRLAEPRQDCPFARGRRAAAWLGRLSNPDVKAASHFDRHDQDADKIATPTPKDLAEAIAWLLDGTSAAGHSLKDAFLAGLTSPDQLTFEQLRTVLTQNTED